MSTSTSFQRASSFRNAIFYHTREAILGAQRTQIFFVPLLEEFKTVLYISISLKILILLSTIQHSEYGNFGVSFLKCSQGPLGVRVFAHYGAQLLGSALCTKKP
jgi:hypothetical protein